MLGRLGEYEILEVIGRGGMGVVLKGYQRELNRYVAVKVMAPHYASSGAARKRFAREAQAAAAVVHPHVVAIHTIEASARLPYLVMPFVAAKSLQARINETGPLELNEILRIGKQTAEGLAAAHAQGLVHRDIKPANILLEDDVGRVLLTDFGLARAVDDASMTHSSVIAGTPQYMSPEQARGESVSHQADLFSLGSVLYAMCAGRPPFRAETTMGILRHICEDPPRPPNEVNPEVPIWLTAIIQRLHAKQPHDRFQSAQEVADLLEHCLAHVQQPTTVPLPETLRNLDRPSKRRSIRTPQIIGISITAASVVIIAIGLAAATNSPNTKPTDSKQSPAGRNQEVIPLEDTEIASPPVWDDGIAEEIGDVNIDTFLLEKQSQRDWDESPSALLNRMRLNTQQPSDLEPIQ